MTQASLRVLSFIFVLLFLSTPIFAQQTAIVRRVVDGDTLKISYKGQKESIRLIGIDTPESRINKKTKKDAKRSGQDVETIIAMGKRATVYVEGLVKPGYANMMTIPPNIKYKDQFIRIYQEAREKGMGLWRK